MRNFVISTICLGLLIATWGIFDFYSKQKVEEYQTRLDHTIIKTVESENWKKAYSDFEQFIADWKDYKKRAAFFLDTQPLNETEYTIARAKYYMKAKDISNTSGELASLSKQLLALHENEALSAKNIF